MTAPGSTSRRLGLAGLAVALVLAAVVSFYASSSPDGLERVAEDEGFLDAARDHDLADGPFAGYDVDGVDDERTSVGLAGATGVVVTLAVAVGLFRLLRRSGPSGGDDDGDEDGAGDGAGDTPDPPSGETVGSDADAPGRDGPDTGQARAGRSGEPAVRRPTGRRG